MSKLGKQLQRFVLYRPLVGRLDPVLMVLTLFLPLANVV
jgi:hypothetical protein